MKENVAVFGGGCFWCTEAIFKMLRGVVSVEPGYTGGTKKNPTYEEVCSGETGHVEVVRIIFDPSKISYHALLTVFFATHDPSSLNRQGNDIGTQYRSAVFYADAAQKDAAETFIRELNEYSREGKRIVTVVEPLREFYPAENYHKDYYTRNSGEAYCQIVINPKLDKVREHFAKLLDTQKKKP
jgi:peptide-methionine (S)-S-oxide reductase